MGSGGLSRARLGRLRDVMLGHVERGEVPGAVWLVSRRGEVHVDAVGTTTYGGADPLRRDAIFRISSLSKPVTAAAAMILVEDCALRLDDPVDRLLPELAGRRVLRRLDAELDDAVPADRPITVRDLLTFRMGFGVVMAMPGTYPIQRAEAELRLGQGAPNPSLPPAPDEWVRRLGTLPLLHQPGAAWMYNTGSDVLGVLIARASGQPFETFLRERLFEPLGMRDSGFSVPAADLGRLPASYFSNPATGAVFVYDEPMAGQWSRPPAFPSGAGGMVSTLDDYHAFAAMLADGGGRVLSRTSVELMTSDQLTAEQKAASSFMGLFDSHGWGFGVAVVTRRESLGPSAGSYGWDGGMGTVWRTDPREELITILMTQRAWTSPKPPDVTRDFWTAAYAAVE